MDQDVDGDVVCRLFRTRTWERVVGCLVHCVPLHMIHTYLYFNESIDHPTQDNKAFFATRLQQYIYIYPPTRGTDGLLQVIYTIVKWIDMVSELNSLCVPAHSETSELFFSLSVRRMKHYATLFCYPCNLDKIHPILISHF